MADATTAMVRYVFLDVVGFTSKRSVEAQAYIVEALNAIVLKSLADAAIEDFERLLIPTGDGICVALLSQRARYDVHIDVARRILAAVAEHNAATTDAMRQFEIRVGINANVDNVVRDVNGEKNLAGAGISTAQRIMDLAGPSNVLLGPSVYEVLATRESYMGQFKAYSAEVKHGARLNVYQYTAEGVSGLSVKAPPPFLVRSEKPKRLSELAAAYMAEAIENEEAIGRLNKGGAEEYCLITLLQYRAEDRIERRHATRARPATHPKTRPKDAAFEDQFAYYYDQEYWLVADLSTVTTERILGPYWECFEEATVGRCFLYVSEEGRRRLRTEWPDMLQIAE